MKLTKKFGKYSVELEVVDNPAPDESRSDCRITHTTRAGREYIASLAMAQDTGVLWNSVYGDIDIEEAIIDDITEWAEENGY